ncbi:hypothetical protein V2J09_020491 [Rumex salicifolius]
MNTLGALVEANELGVYDDDIVYELDVECAHEKSPSPENDASCNGKGPRTLGVAAGSRQSI